MIQTISTAADPSTDSPLSPAPGMSKPNDTSTLPPDKAAGAPDELFILHSDYWVQMQNYATKTLNIPGDSASFKTKYGDFTDETQVETCVGLFKTISDLGASFGNPITLVQNIDQFTNLNTPPTQLYGHVVWLANQIRLSATNIHDNMSSAFGNNGSNLGSSSAERKTNLDTLLLGTHLFDYTAADVSDVITQLNNLTLPSSLAAAFGTNGSALGNSVTVYKGYDTGTDDFWLYDQANAAYYYIFRPKAINSPAILEIHDGYGINTTAQEMALLSTNLATLIGNYSTALNAAVNGPTNSLASYLLQQDNIYNAAVGDEKEYEDDITALQKQISEDNKKYIGFTVAACASAFMLFIPFVGPFLAVADAVTFGVLAEKTKKEIDSLKQQVSQDQIEEQQKKTLVADVQSLNADAGDLQSWGTKFIADLGSVAGSWAQLTTDLLNISSNTQASDLENMPAFLSNNRIESAYTEWEKVETITNNFITKSFVQYTTQS